MTSTTITSLLLFLTPSNLSLNGSLIAADSAATTYAVQYPSAAGFGAATVTVAPTQPIGTYGLQASIPNTGLITLDCTTSAGIPTACSVTSGPIAVATTPVASQYEYLPVTVTAGLEKLQAVSTDTAMASTAGATTTASDSAGASTTSGAAGVRPSSYLGTVGLGVLMLLLLSSELRS